MFDNLHYFPPLTHPPRWASASPPKRHTLSTLRLKVTAVLEHIEYLRNIINLQPWPSQGTLYTITCPPPQVEEVLDDLRTMRYPADLTDWIDTARTLARQTSDDLDACTHALSKLKALPPNTRPHQRYLNCVREASGRAYQHSEMLNSHIEHLYAALPERSQPSDMEEHTATISRFQR